MLLLVGALHGKPEKAFGYGTGIVSYLRSFEIIDSAERNVHPISTLVLVYLRNILLHTGTGTIRNKIGS
jgi:hypothetical protein